MRRTAAVECRETAVVNMRAELSRAQGRQANAVSARSRAWWRPSASRRVRRMRCESGLRAASALLVLMTCSSASSVCRKRMDCFRISSRLDIRMSRHTVGVACGDAREVAKTRAGQRQEVAPRRLLRGHRIEVRKRQHVRQVAHGGKRGVVVLGRHAQHLRTDGGPHVGGLLHAARGWFACRWREDDLAAVVQAWRRRG